MYNQNYNQSNTPQKQLVQNQKPKNETIKVCVRVRPLLHHEDAEFWQVDEKNHTISTIK
jgi:hypothetical protein